MGNAVISTHQLSFSYRSSPALVLSDLNLTIGDGEIVAILGANGSGKSTLARLFGGLLLPTSGRVQVDGMDTLALPVGWAMHQHVGMVFQNPQNQIVSTVVQNEVAFSLENLLVSSSVMQHRVQECLELVGLSHLAEANPHELSAGEQQRLAIASALAASPRHLLLDEATSLLDDQSRMDLMDSVQTLAHRLGLSVVLITHRMDEVPAADRVLVLSQGHLVFSGSPADLFAASERLSDWNLRLPPLQELALGLRHAGLDAPLGLDSASELAESIWP